LTEEVPVEEIEAAEGANLDHSHEGISTEDASLIEHLKSQHQFDTEPGLSASTQQGLHDRMHGETDAAGE